MCCTSGAYPSKRGRVSWRGGVWPGTMSHVPQLERWVCGTHSQKSLSARGVGKRKRSMQILTHLSNCKNLGQRHHVCLSAEPHVRRRSRTLRQVSMQKRLCNIHNFCQTLKTHKITKAQTDCLVNGSVVTREMVFIADLTQIEFSSHENLKLQKKSPVLARSFRGSSHLTFAPGTRFC